MASKQNPLQKMREDQLFQHGVDYVRRSAGGIKKINSQELAHLNQMLMESTDEPWRLQPAAIQIGGSGQVHHFNIVSNPMQRARELCGDATQTAGNNEAIKGAFVLYAELVLAHLFNEANRRTAALAALWILEQGGHSVDPQALLSTPIGNLRDQTEYTAFEARFKALVAKA